MKSYLYIAVACITISLIAMEKPDETGMLSSNQAEQYKYYCIQSKNGAQHYFIGSIQSSDNPIIEQAACNPHAYQRCFDQPIIERELTSDDYLLLKTVHLTMASEQETVRKLLAAGTGFFRGAN